MPDYSTVPDIPDYVGAITSSGELISVLPLLLTYRPVDSLVLITHTGPTGALFSLIRLPLPAADDVPALVAQLRDLLVANEAVAVSVVVIGGEPINGASGRVPQWGLVHALTVELRAAEIGVHHPLWASSTNPTASWRCYRSCRCGGAVPALDTSPVAAALIAAGATTSDSREMLAATLAADPSDQLQRRAAMLDALLRSPTGHEDDTEAAYRLVQDAITTAAADPALPVLTDAHIVALARALSVPGVVDRCLAAAVPATSPHPDGAGSAGDGEADVRLWTVLTRAVPGPHRAVPAFLLAVSTLLRGRGVLAAIALDIALTADPGHSVARLLQVALQHGMTPDQLHDLLHNVVPAALDDED